MSREQGTETESFVSTDLFVSQNRAGGCILRLMMMMMMMMMMMRMRWT